MDEIKLYKEKSISNLNEINEINLNNCFEYNEHSSEIKFFCNKCLQNTKVISYNKLNKCSDILTIIIYPDNFSNPLINFSLDLNLSLEQFINDKSNSYNYQLIGFLYFNSQNDVTKCFSKFPDDNQWFYYNGSTRSKSQNNVESIIKSNGIPSLLFYQKNSKIGVLKSEGKNDNNSLNKKEIKNNSGNIISNINENDKFNINNKKNEKTKLYYYPIEERKKELTTLLTKEYRKFHRNPVNNLGLTIGLLNDDDIFAWKACFPAPQDSSYKGGFFKFKIIFPQYYPECRPEIAFITPIYHLNVQYFSGGSFSLGHVSAKFLNIWEPKSKLLETFSQLYPIFYMSNPDSCYDNSNQERRNEFLNNRDLYEIKVRYFTQKYAHPYKFNKYDNNNKSWDFTLDESDPIFLEVKEKYLESKKKEISNNPNNKIDKRERLQNNPNDNINEVFTLNFTFHGDNIGMMCNSNESLEEIINRLREKINLDFRNIMYIYHRKRITNMQIPAKYFKDNNEILIIDKNYIF